jgi:hypothetical protein
MLFYNGHGADRPATLANALSANQYIIHKSQLPLLAAYLEDGRLEVDNNLIENTIRPLALERKNYSFAGSHNWAHRTAMMYAFFTS